MKWYTHLACITMILAALTRFFPLTLGFILFTMIGSLLPDLLEAWIGLPHRSKYIHNLAVVTLLIPLGLFNEWLLGLGIAYAHHVVLDATTVTGSYICNRRIKGPLKTNILAHNIFVMLMHLPILMISIR